jgi:YD repeat-containing protein
MPCYRICFVVAVFVLASCSGDDKPVRCAPISISPGMYDDGTVNFRRDAHFNVIEVSSGSNGESDMFKYDDRGMLTTVQHVSAFGDLSETTLKYDANDRVISTSAIIVNSQSVVVHEEVLFFYDEQDRLFRKVKFMEGNYFSTLTYEYVGRNAVNVFYESIEEERVTAMVMLAFDSQKRFFAGDKALTAYFVYVRGVEPSENNVLAALVRKPYPLITYDEPKELKLSLTYDDQGRPISHVIISGPDTAHERLFEEIDYSCQ